MSILRRNSPPGGAESESDPQGNSFVPRFEHPKTIAIDLPKGDVEEIQAAGFNITAGSFGTPMRVPKADRYLQVPINGHLPGATEQEVVVADLATPAISDNLDVGEEPVGEAIWQHLGTGTLDPRPNLMLAFRPRFDRIYSHGGAFILFADRLNEPAYVRATARSLGYGDKVYANNWSLLTALSDLNVSPDFGSEITVTDGLSRPIADALRASSFTCVVEPYESAAKRWITLAKSKFGKPIAGLLLPEDEAAGCIFVLPRVPQKGRLVRELLEDLLPRFAPKLFPENERQAWIKDDAYAPEGVAALHAEIDSVRTAAEIKVNELKGQIDKLRAENSHLHELLTESGDKLVAAVKKTLEEIGFDDVRDIDEDGQKNGRLHEDLQIHPESPAVIIEVKGLNNLPSDEDALEVQKYVLTRIREWKRTDVRGLTVVNHQRALPPTERNPNCFQRAQIENAKQQDVGLITTWDLFRLARGYKRNGWRPEQVASLFTTATGSVEPIPAHYRPIGTVVNFFEKAKAVAIQLNEDVELRVGEQIALIGEIDYIEQEVESIQMDDQQVQHAPAGSGVGVKTEFSKEQVRLKTTVYKSSG